MNGVVASIHMSGVSKHWMLEFGIGVNIINKIDSSKYYISTCEASVTPYHCLLTWVAMK